jgi:hypothetical protein
LSALQKTKFASQNKQGNPQLKKICLTLSLLSSLSASVYAGEPAPELLVHAAQCLTVKNHLPPAKATALSLGYMVDERSYPGEKVLYLVDYPSSNRSQGYVFTIFLTQKGDSQIFDIQNNAKFVTTKGQIDFDEPPLGGAWTQEHLISAINHIVRQPTNIVPVRDLLAPSPLVMCRSYTDNKQ